MKKSMLNGGEKDVPIHKKKSRIKRHLIAAPGPLPGWETIKHMNLIRFLADDIAPCFTGTERKVSFLNLASGLSILPVYLLDEGYIDFALVTDVSLVSKNYVDALQYQGYQDRLKYHHYDLMKIETLEADPFQIAVLTGFLSRFTEKKGFDILRELRSKLPFANDTLFIVDGLTDKTVKRLEKEGIFRSKFVCPWESSMVLFMEHLKRLVRRGIYKNIERNDALYNLDENSAKKINLDNTAARYRQGVAWKVFCRTWNSLVVFEATARSSRGEVTRVASDASIEKHWFVALEPL